MARCCAILRNKKTGKLRRCRREASGTGYYCDEHQTITDYAEMLHQQAEQALANANAEE